MLEIKLCSVAATHFTPLSPWSGAEGEADCERTCLYSRGSEAARHFTPLSPWRGVGGEAGYFFHSAGFSRHSFNSTTSSLAMYPVSTAFCTTCS